MTRNQNGGACLETVLEKVGRSMSDRFGIRVVCQGNRCCTDGHTIYLPGLPDDLPDEIVGTIRGFLDHETGHVAGRSNFRIAKLFKTRYGDDGFTFLNMLEDLRVEEYMRQRFPGCRRNLEQVYKTSCSEAEKASAAESVPVLKQLAFGICSRGNHYPDLTFVSPKVYETLDMISDEVEKASTRRNTKEVARLAEKAWPVIVQRLFSAASSAQPPPQPDGPGSNGNQVQGNQAPPGAQPDPAHQGNPSTTTLPQQTAGSGGNGTTQQENGSAGDIMKDVANTIVRLVNAYSSKNSVYRVWDTSQDTVETAQIPRSCIPHQERMAALLPHVAGVRQKLLQTLLAEPKARWLEDKEAGNINPRALHRLAAPTDNASGNARVFRERFKTRRIHTACTLLVDQSSSMKGQRIELASQTAMVFCEALSRLNIPCAVLGFSTHRHHLITPEVIATYGKPISKLEDDYRIYPLRHTYYKHFHEQLRLVSGRFDHLHSHDWTPLGESILFAARELAQRKEERKVLFVMTDGMPQVGRGMYHAAYEHARSMIKRVENAGIEIALVGILENRVLQLHHRSVVVKSLYDLPKTVMRQMQSVLVDTRKYAI